MKLLFVSLILIITLSYVKSARILGILPSPSHSHELAFRKIWDTLANKGHEVVLMTTLPKYDKLYPNLKEIDWSYAFELESNTSIDKINSGSNIIKLGLSYFESRKKIIAYEMQHVDVQNLIHNKSEHFDVVITESFLPVFLGFSYRFNAPLVGLISNEIPYFMRDYVGEPSHPLLYPDITNASVKNKMTLYERVKIVVKRVVIELFRKVILLSPFDGMLQEYFGKDCPSEDYLNKNVDLLISIQNKALHTMRPEVPGHIHISGLNILPAKPLNKEMQEYMDGSKNGVIYFSLGSSVKSKDISKEILGVIKDTFRELPYDILWKFELPELEGKPDNVKIVKWAQQQDILRHPNLKLFITQGGLQSIEEALYTYNPMLLLPVAGDQNYNAKMVVDKGYGLELNIKNLDKEEFKKTILELINNPKYKNRVKEMVDLAKDEPMPSLEKAIWWIEYVIRNKGAKQLKAARTDIPLYEYLMLDVISVILTILIITIYASYLLIKYIILALKKTVNNSKKKNN